ncbi:MAG TPA: 50S ribosomal protein L32 [Myxococcaceae bacterium]|nr:50S ribosomal protein L32 [Myxococcaceae bacterium]
MGVPKKRTSKMRRDRRRAANNNLRSAVQVINCANCKEPVLPHRACAACGYYKGREAIAGAEA